ncbi:MULTISPECIES: regulatory protein RecX [Caloramator]|uniref:Regulatory protein RecX n=1 Tax=Caloramator proteoclasticus DSM 10124 TaxID=1121262 RepID=A0A1M4SNT9_9CLOT|nr:MULTISPECIES: RecX family transcriptional regulator [Caloramator]SHE33944.1 regulatory protein [Caloramator proteoclasticus DSM 10124]
MQITGIEKQKKNSERYNIYIDGTYSFSAELEDIIKYDIKIDRNISENELSILIQKCEINKGYRYALNLLNVKDYSKKEFIDKLKQKGYSEKSIDIIINKLEEYGLIDDFKYANKYVRKKINMNKLGKLRIINELKLKGVNNNIVEKINFDEDKMLNNAYNLAIKKLKGNKNENEDLTKVARFLYYKGYTNEEIKKVLKKIDKDIEWE